MNKKITTITVQGHHRFLHERAFSDVSFKELCMLLHEHSLDRVQAKVVIGITRFNVFRLPAIIGFLKKYNPHLPDESLFFFPVFPLASISERFHQFVEKITSILSELSFSVKITDPDIFELFRIASDHTDSAFALGAVCETALCPPERVLVDLTTVCNSDCIYCRTHSNLTESRITARFLDWSILHPFIRELHQTGVTNISAVGSGEPTLYPYFEDFLELCFHEKMSLDFSTNGATLNESLIEKIIETQVNSVTVSISGTNPHVYQCNHPATAENYQKILDNCRMLAEQKKKSNSHFPYLIMLHCLNIHSFNTAQDAVIQAAELGFNAVWLQMLHVDQLTRDLKIPQNCFEQMAEDIEKARILARQYNIEFHEYIDFQIENANTYDGTWSDSLMSQCLVGYNFSYLCVDNYLNFCCGIKPIGRITKKTGFSQLWYSDIYNLYRFTAAHMNLLNIDTLSNHALYTKRFLKDDFCRCCDNHNLNTCMQNNISRCSLNTFMLPFSPTYSADVSVLAPDTFSFSGPVNIRVKFSVKNGFYSQKLYLYFYFDQTLLCRMLQKIPDNCSGEWHVSIDKIPCNVPRLKIFGAIVATDTADIILSESKPVFMKKISGPERLQLFDTEISIHTITPCNFDSQTFYTHLSEAEVTQGSPLSIKLASNIAGDSFRFSIHHVPSGKLQITEKEFMIQHQSFSAEILIPRILYLTGTYICSTDIIKNNMVIAQTTCSFNILPSEHEGIFIIPHRSKVCYEN